MAKVTVYSTQNCPYCRMAKALLDRLGVEYESIDVGQDHEKAAEMVRVSGQYGVPVITVGDEVIVGFDSPRLQELFGTGPRDQTADILIVGAGPAGLTAGVYAARKILRTIIVSENIGGQALESWAIENYMGYRMISGDDLMHKFEEQVRSQQIQLEVDRVSAISREGDIFVVRTAADQAFRARTVLLAQGKRPRKLGIEGEERFLGRGLSVCSTCDGPLFREKTVAVVGGGNSAVQTAIEMSRIAKEVHLVVRSRIRADEAYMSQYSERPNIVTHLGYTVSRLLGENLLTGITIREASTGKEETIFVDGVFAETGWIPNTEFLAGLCTLNEAGEIVIDINGSTSQPGIFAAGDVTNVKGKQIIIAAGEGAKAALEAYEYLVRRG